MSTTSFLFLAISTGVCKGCQNEWEKHTLILKCLIQAPQRGIHCSLTLCFYFHVSWASKEASLYFSHSLSLFIWLVKQRFKEKEISILLPWKTFEKKIENKMENKFHQQESIKIKHTQHTTITLFWDEYSSKSINMPPKKGNSEIQHSLCHSLSCLVSFSHISSDSQSYINISISLSTILMVSYIFQWLICSILQKHFNTFYIPPESSMMQRCLSKWLKKNKRFFWQIHFIPPVNGDVCHIHLGKKLTHFLLFSSFSPHHSHQFIISAPINSLNSSISKGKVITKHTPWNRINEKNLWEWKEGRENG